MKRPPITLEKWTQTADTVWMDNRTSAVVKTIDSKGQVTRANHSTDCAHAQAVAALPDLLRALEFVAKYHAMQEEKGNPVASQLVSTIKGALEKAGYTA